MSLYLHIARRKDCARVLQSCRPSLRFCVGSFDSMKKVTIVTSFDALITVLLFCMLSLRTNVEDAGSVWDMRC